MTLLNVLIADIEGALSGFEKGVAPIKIGKTITGPEVGVVPLKRIRGSYYEAVKISGGWTRDAWSHPARDNKGIRRDKERFVAADAVGVVLPNGQRLVIDPQTYRLVRFVELIDGSIGR